MAENTNVGTTSEEVGAAAENGEPKTFTEEEVAMLLQREGDKRVSQALAKQKKEYDKKLSLSQLDGDARERAEKDNRIAELEDRLKEFSILQNKNEVIKVLSARGLNPAFADLVEIGEDAEVAQGKIEQLDKLFKAAVADEVKKRLAGSIPKDSTTKSDSITKADFNKMTLAQQTQIYRENPELYKKLTK